ncbi:unnamed protein product [Caretta caretta]
MVQRESDEMVGYRKNNINNRIMSSKLLLPSAGPLTAACFCLCTINIALFLHSQHRPDHSSTLGPFLQAPAAPSPPASLFSPLKMTLTVKVFFFFFYYLKFFSASFFYLSLGSSTFECVFFMSSLNRGRQMVCLPACYSAPLLKMTDVCLFPILHPEQTSNPTF